jgi:hypothetical protein
MNAPRFMVFDVLICQLVTALSAASGLGT